MYQADESRYDKMSYKRCRKQRHPASAGIAGHVAEFWRGKPLPEQKKIIFRAFDLGITHFDLAKQLWRAEHWNGRGKLRKDF